MQIQEAGSESASRIRLKQHLITIQQNKHSKNNIAAKRIRTNMRTTIIRRRTGRKEEEGEERANHKDEEKLIIRTRIKT